MASKKRRADKGLIVGVIAIAINIITVSVYVYQARIMQTQQHASAWPYLEWLAKFNEETGYKLEVKNNGIGPAIIKSVSIRINNKELANLDSMFVQLIGTDYFPHVTSPIQNRVLPPGESMLAFDVKDSEWSEKLYSAVGKVNFEYEICYESIYGDQWTCKGTEVVESKCN
ncbi:MAG: hypothetical protein ACMVP2_27575 [Imperialibacter sp.]|uniref:hypothetical protein n=1 Tax=Imperialibacter sp. TaxID=2038411 RepID=UPI003A8A9DEC